MYNYHDGVIMKISMTFGATASLEMSTEDMSEDGQAAYLAAHAVSAAQDGARAVLWDAIRPDIARLPAAEVAVLRQLATEPLHPTEELISHLRQMTDARTIENAQKLIQINREQAQAQWEMAVIARNEYYDLMARKGHEGRAELERQQRDLVRKARTDMYARSLLEHDEGYFQTDPFKINMERMAAFDQVALPVLNGEMLQRINTYKKAELVMDMHAATVESPAVKVAPVLAPKSPSPSRPIP